MSGFVFKINEGEGQNKYEYWYLQEVSCIQKKTWIQKKYSSESCEFIFIFIFY